MSAAHRRLPAAGSLPCRRNPQEAAYNLGRAAHHLGLLHIAVPYYERVLESAPPPSVAAAGALPAGLKGMVGAMLCSGTLPVLIIMEASA